MDKKLKDAKTILEEAKDDLKEVINNQFSAAKKSVGDHLDNASDATKEAIVDMANQIKKATDVLSAKLQEHEDKGKEE